MRWILLITLVANAAFWFWNAQAARRVTETVPVVTRADMVTQLVLLEELKDTELRQRQQQTGTAQSVEGDGQEAAAEAADGGAQGGDNGTPKTAAAPALAVALHCYSVGPFDDSTRDGGVAEWLRQRGAHLEVREDERRELSRYWVHFPPFASKEEADGRVETLRGRGFTDMQVVRRGNMANSVSLGVYSRKAHLDRRVAALSDAGFPPQVHKRYRTSRASWFDVVLPVDVPLQETELAADYPDIEARERPCGAPTT